MAPLQPHASWYRRFWYAEHSARDTLMDRTLIFAIVALSLLAGGMVLIQRGASLQPRGQLPVADVTHYGDRTSRDR